MNTKLFAIKIPENEKIAMDYISNETNNTLSKLFYEPIKDAIYTDLGLILVYKIDMQNTTKVSTLYNDFLSHKSLTSRSLPIIEDFVGLILDKNLKNEFWKIFGDIQLNEKDFMLHELDIIDMATHMGQEYIINHGSFDKINLDLARNIFFNYMLVTYFNTTAVGSITQLNLEWSNHQTLIKQFQGQLIAKYVNKYQPKKLEAIKIDELVEVSEYLE
jgi:hypothetical protein